MQAQGEFNSRSQAHRWKQNQGLQGREYDWTGQWDSINTTSRWGFFPYSYSADSVAASVSANCLSEGFSEKLKPVYDQGHAEAEENRKLFSPQLRQERNCEINFSMARTCQVYLRTPPEFLCLNSLSSGNQPGLKVVPLWTGFGVTWLQHSAEDTHYNRMLATQPLGC